MLMWHFVQLWSFRFNWVVVITRTPLSVSRSINTLCDNAMRFSDFLGGGGGGGGHYGPLHAVLIYFWSHSTDFLLFLGLWLVEQFPHIYGQTADRIGLKFGGPTPYAPSPSLIDFWSCSTEFSTFPGLWVVKFSSVQFSSVPSGRRPGMASVSRSCV